MATGDHIRTGINKSFECGILQSERWIIASYDHSKEKISWKEIVNDEDRRTEVDESAGIEDLEEPDLEENVPLLEDEERR